MTGLEQQILDLLEVSRSPVQRDDLVRLTGFPDRANRDAIASLQQQGYPIVSLGKGYWLGDHEEIRSYVTRETSRAISILSKMRHLKPKIQELIGQLRLML